MLYLAAGLVGVAVGLIIGLEIGFTQGYHRGLDTLHENPLSPDPFNPNQP